MEKRNFNWKLKATLTDFFLVHLAQMVGRETESFDFLLDFVGKSPELPQGALKVPHLQRCWMNKFISIENLQKQLLFQKVKIDLLSQ